MGGLGEGEVRWGGEGTQCVRVTFPRQLSLPLYTGLGRPSVCLGDDLPCPS